MNNRLESVNKKSGGERNIAMPASHAGKTISFFGIFFLLLFMPALAPAEEQPAAKGKATEGVESGLVAWWKFDEGTGETAGDSLNRGEFNGKITNCEWVQGIKGKALKFNGVDSRVVVNPNPALDLTSSCTLSVWVKIDETDKEYGVIKKYYEIINKARDIGPGYRLRYGYSTITFRTGIDNHQSWAVTTVRGKTNVSLGEWHHIAATYDGSKYKIYVDGEEAASLDESRSITTEPKNPLTIGGYIGKNAYQFKGMIDEVKIYNRALTSLEIMKEAHLE